MLGLIRTATFHRSSDDDDVISRDDLFVENTLSIGDDVVVEDNVSQVRHSPPDAVEFIRTLSRKPIGYVALPLGQKIHRESA